MPNYFFLNLKKNAFASEFIWHPHGKARLFPHSGFQWMQQLTELAHSWAEFSRVMAAVQVDHGRIVAT